MFRGDWRNIEFKEYNFSAKGPPPEGGHLHPLNKARITLFFFNLFSLFLYILNESYTLNFHTSYRGSQL
jgi:hypothetical protein